MRNVIAKDQITPFGLWVRQYGLPSKTCSVTNLDYIFEDYKNKKIMLVEEKSNAGKLWPAQKMTIAVLDYVLSNDSARKYSTWSGYQYLGFYVIEFPKGCDMVGPGLKINGIDSTVEELRNLIRFENISIKPMDLSREHQRFLRRSE